MSEQHTVTVTLPDGEEITAPITAEMAALLETMTIEERGAYISDAIVEYGKRKYGQPL